MRRSSWHPRRPALLLVVLLFPACGGGGSPAPAGPSVVVTNLRPVDSPDIVVISVSGHAGALSALLCDSDGNVAYLGDPGGGRDPVVQVFVDLGLTVQVADFADRIYALDDNVDGAPDDPRRLGFDDLIATLQFVRREWISDFDDPTRIVVIAHSHGATWAHIAASILPDVPIDYLISLDGICFQWECEHSVGVAAWLAASGLSAPYDISRPCNAVPVAGFSSGFNFKDVAFDNVSVNLEIQSTGLTSDCCDNIRLDGSRAGILSKTVLEGHSRVDDATSDALDWVVDQIRLFEASR